jgi:hypothetical protein
MLTRINTVWLYPQADIDTALATTTHPYTFDGAILKCPTLNDLRGVYEDIYNVTTVTQPVGNVGYTLGVGSLLEYMGRDIRLCIGDGSVVVIWRLVRQLTPQLPATVIPAPGNSPNGTVGYVTTFCSYGNGATGGYNNGFDDALVVSVG